MCLFLLWSLLLFRIGGVGWNPDLHDAQINLFCQIICAIPIHASLDDRSIQFRDACPEHKRKDLDALVKSLKGDEGAIQAAIVEWWNEPQQVEPEWEVKEKKPKKAAPAPTSSSGGGGGRRGSSERDGGRGDRRDRRDDRRGGGGGTRPTDRPRS